MTEVFTWGITMSDHHETILIVDDDPAIQQVLGKVLRGHGWKVVIVADGRQALALLPRVPCDAMILDLLLPNLNGFEVLRHVKCTAPHLLGRTIVITGAAERTYRGCRDLDLISSVIRKPFEVEALEEAVRRCLTQAGSSQAVTSNPSR